MNEERRSTGVHEAGHAVVSYVLGRRIMHVLLFTDKRGETVPMCSVCDICLAYYSDNNPSNNAHPKHIQDGLRCDMAIALAGEIAQRAICGNQNIDEREFAKDRALAKEKASAIHLWRDRVCWQFKYSACQICHDYHGLMTRAAEKMVALRYIKDSIQALAEELEKLKDDVRMDRSRIEQILKASGLTEGSEIGSLPPAG
jgi:hypothetical protein